MALLAYYMGEKKNTTVEFGMSKDDATVVRIMEIFVFINDSVRLPQPSASYSTMEIGKLYQYNNQSY